ncbi:MAG: LPS export ABC transporter permease LptG [Alphaproteobacteria bacterium]|nr:LPS export ABC transporter permease LptG [Alphaproteobacteria bacterium]
MPPWTLFKYLIFRAALTMTALFFALSALIFVADFMENLRFAEKYADGSFGFAVQLTALRTPGLSQLLTPFIFLFGGFWMFSQLNRKSELAVMRSAGLSIWRLIGPPVLFAGAAGACMIAVVDPMASRMTAASEFMMNQQSGKQTSLVRVFGDGIWLRQRDGDAILIVNADQLEDETATLRGVTVWRLTPESVFLERIDAPVATLDDRLLRLEEAALKTPSAKLPRKTPSYVVPTNLRIDDLRAGTPVPETIAVWDLPRFADVAEAAGLPRVRYDMRFHDLLSTPVKLMAMVMIAAMFSLRPARSGGAFQMVIAGVVVGFALYFVTEIAGALGESGAAPAALAAWAPAALGAVVAMTGLLHVEEG